MALKKIRLLKPLAKPRTFIKSKIEKGKQEREARIMTGRLAGIRHLPTKLLKTELTIPGDKENTWVIRGNSKTLEGIRAREKTLKEQGSKTLVLVTGPQALFIVYILKPRERSLREAIRDDREKARE